MEPQTRHWKSMKEFYNSSANARKLIKDSIPGLYATWGNVEDLPLEIVQVDEGWRDRVIPDYHGTFCENLERLFNRREEAEKEIKRMKENPPREDCKWWSTGEIMNLGEIRAHPTRIERLREGVKAINELFDSIDKGTYKIRNVKEFVDWKFDFLETT